MNMTLSITSRKQIYFPQVLLKALNLPSPGKVVIDVLPDSSVKFRPVKSFLEFAGIAKDKAKFEYWKTFRDKMETEYEEVY